jgi:hypothetical protein
VSHQLHSANLPRRLEDFHSYMDKFANPPPGKTPAYYVVMRPKNLSPRQIDIMHQVALLMLEQNETCAAPRPLLCMRFTPVHANFRQTDSRKEFHQSSKPFPRSFRSL